MLEFEEKLLSAKSFQKYNIYWQ